MFKIGEFSKLTQVSVRMLRYYDEAGLLKPAKTDPYTSYRLYSAEQISRLNRIVFLRDLGFLVAEIAVALDHWDDDLIAGLLEGKRRETEKALVEEREKLLRIELAQKDLLRERMSVHSNVTIKSIPSYQVLSLRRVVPDYYAEGDLWKELSAFVAKRGVAISGSHTFTIYHDVDYRERDVDLELCVCVDRAGTSDGSFVYRDTEPVPQMGCTMVRGPFENIAGAFFSFANWLQGHNQYKMTGTSRQTVHRGQWNEEDPAQYLTEIQIPLERI